MHWIPSQVSKKEKKSTRTFILEMWHDFIILEPDSHLVVWSLGSSKKDPKDNTQGFEFFVFWVFLHDLKDPNDLV